MNALRLLLLSMMIGSAASSNGGYTEQDLLPYQPPVTSMETAQAAQPTPLIIYVTPEPTPAPTRKPSGLDRNLYLGHKGEDVRRVQQLLSDLGYDVAVGGTFSAKTKEAVMHFQAVNGLTIDGIVGDNTYRKLTSKSALGPNGASIRMTLSYGMKGQDVMELQIRLGQLGYYDDIVSGNYLKNTRRAVSWFQEVHGLIADGIAGQQTLYTIFSEYALMAPGKPGSGYKPNPTPSPSAPPLFMRTLKLGMSGADVGYLQGRLKQLGYFPYTPTNTYGEETYWAVYYFQQFNRLKPDGVAGMETLNRVYASDAIPFSSEPSATAQPTPTGTPPVIITPAPTTAPPVIITPAPTGTPVPDICARCNQYIVPGQEQNHMPHIAACGTDKHYNCDGLVHGKQPCGGHLKCLPDGLDHSPCPIAVCGRSLCDGHAHP